MLATHVEGTRSAPREVDGKDRGADRFKADTHGGSTEAWPAGEKPLPIALKS